jgi:hypothetical protein
MSIDEKLAGNGLIFRRYKLRQQSVSSVDRAIVLRVREEARRAGYTQRDINRCEMRGERGEYGLRPQPYEAVFQGHEVLPNGIRLRSYNVVGDHDLAGSTVGMIDLFHHGVMPHEITLIQAVWEYGKEAILIGWMQLSMNMADWFSRVRKLCVGDKNGKTM